MIIIKDTLRETTTSKKIQIYVKSMYTAVFKVDLYKTVFLGGTNEAN